MVHCVKSGVKVLENSLLIKGFSASGSKNALTIACSRSACDGRLCACSQARIFAHKRPSHALRLTQALGQIETKF